MGLEQQQQPLLFKQTKYCILCSSSGEKRKCILNVLENYVPPNSLFQVQLRLQQVVGAAPENRDDLLKELEQFAFRGIPNLSSPRIPEQHQVQPQLQSDCKEAQGDFCETLQAAKEDKQVRSSLRVR